MTEQAIDVIYFLKIIRGSTSPARVHVFTLIYKKQRTNANEGTEPFVCSVSQSVSQSHNSADHPRKRYLGPA